MLGDTPRPPAGSVLHLFYSGNIEITEILSINSLIPKSRGISKAGGHPQTPDRGKSLWTPFTTVIARSDSDEAIWVVVGC